MNILLVSAEVAPFAKAGGLADIAQALPIDWQKFGQVPIIMMPKYGFIDEEKFGLRKMDIVLNVPVDWWTEYAGLWQSTLPGTKIPIYFIENKDYFDRNGIYGDPGEFGDNDRRFIFFSRAIFEAAKALNFSPDIIHAHDFHAAFTMAFLKSQYRFDPNFAMTAGVYTIHNLAYQGLFNAQRAMAFSTFGMSQFYTGSWFEHRGAVNSMKTGIMFADKVTTVSPSYANEIRQAYFSEGLQDILNLRAADLVGVLNGVLYSEWSPEIDNLLYKKFDTNSLHYKYLNKVQFLNDHGIYESDNYMLPLVGMVTRLTEQKGIDLLLARLEEYLASSTFRFTILGSGEAKFENFFRYLAWKYPDKALVHIGYDNSIAHRIIASSDYLLMPSRFEPCGLTQMYALRYGTLPIVRSTGGLADTVREYISESGKGNGFVFQNYNADDLVYAIRRALSIYQVEYHWDLARKNAMADDNSSGRSALEYLKVFSWALEKVK